MFTLSGLFLEDGENLFRDFWSPFSISFITFSACPNYFLKKKSTALRAVSDPDTSARPAFKAAARAPPQPKSQPPPPDPPPAGAARRRRRHANRGSRRFSSENHSVFLETPVNFLDRFSFLANARSFVRFNERFSLFYRQRTFDRQPVRQFFFF